MKAKRKRYSGAFKAKVGLEAILGVKTVGQLAREYQVHPTLITQWRGVIRDRLPELFETPAQANPDSERTIAQLHGHGRYACHDRLRQRPGPYRG